jgi:O-antigen ligase
MSISLDPMSLKLLIIIVGLFLIGVMGAIISKPIIGLAVLCFTLPFNFFIRQLPVPFYPLLGAVILAGYFLAKYQTGTRQENRSRSIRLEYILVLLYVFWIVITNPSGALYSTDLHHGETVARSWMFTYLQLAVLYYLGTQISPASHFSWLALALMLGTAVSAMYGFDASNIGGSWAESSRLKGADGDPNFLAQWALCSFAFAPAVLAMCRARWQKIAVLMLALLEMLIVIFSLSRTGLLTLSLLLIIWLILGFSLGGMLNTRNLLLGLGGLIVVTLVATPWEYWSIMYNGIIGGVMEKQGSMGMRFSYWQAAYEAFKSSPIWGIGVGNFKDFAQSLGSFRIDVVHNSYLDVLTENGIVGLTLFLAWQIIALRRFWGVLKNAGDNSVRFYALAGFSGLAAVMFMALTLNNQYLKILWLLAGYSGAFTVPSLAQASQQPDGLTANLATLNQYPVAVGKSAKVFW